MNVAIRKIGNSEGLILPKEVLARLRLKAGDQVSLVETPDGIKLVPFDQELERKMEVARKRMHKYRGAHRELAK